MDEYKTRKTKAYNPLNLQDYLQSRQRLFKKIKPAKLSADDIKEIESSCFIHTPTTYVYDYRISKYTYIHESIEQLTGHTVAEFVNSGLDYTRSLLVPTCRSVIESQIFPLMGYCSKEYKKESLIFEYNYSYRSAWKGIYKSMLQRCIITERDLSDRPVVQYGCLQDITPYADKKTMYFRVAYGTSPHVTLLEKSFDVELFQLLSIVQMDILKYSTDGMTTEQVATQLYMLPAEIVAQKNQVVRLFECRDWNEAIALHSEY